MDGVRWVWDSRKSKANERNHRLDFETARLVFDDPFAFSKPDFHRGEERWQTLGVIDRRTVFVVHTWPEFDPATGDVVGRIISARKATRHERRMYEESAF